MLALALAGLAGPARGASQSPPDGARHHDEALAGGACGRDADHEAWHGDDLCRDPLRRFRAPYFIWDNYLTIFTFHDQVKGNIYDTVAAVALVVPFTIVLCCVETRLGFDMEDRIGWSLVPFAMFVGIKMRVARHLLIVLLVPDKRGPRNIAASIGLALYAAAPEVFRLGSVLYITTVLLFAFLAYYLRRIGWATVRDDARHPLRTVRLLLSEPRPGSLAA